MKTLLLTVCLAIIVMTGFSQIPKGTTYAGFSLLSAYTQFTHYDGTVKYGGPGFSLHPSYGWFVLKNLSVGGQLDAYFGQYAALKGEFTPSVSTRSLGGSIFIRDYIWLTSRLSAVVGADYGWQKGKSHTAYRSHTGSVNTFGARAGAAWFVNNRIVLELTAGYNRRNQYDLAHSLQTPFEGVAVEIGVRRWVITR